MEKDKTAEPKTEAPKKKAAYEQFKVWFAHTFKLFEDAQTGEVSWCYRSMPKRLYRNGKTTLWAKTLNKYPRLRKDFFLVVLRSAKKTPVNSLRNWVEETAKNQSGENPFEKLAAFIKAEGLSDFTMELEKHFLRAVGSVMGGVPNKQIFCLVSEEQNIGKTHFVHWLYPEELKDRCMGSLPYAKSKLDLMLAKMFLVNIDEFDGIKKTGGATLKKITSQDTASLYIAFKNIVEIKPRITSFFATRNYSSKGFLNDETGSSRFIVFDMKMIDWKGYTREIKPSSLWEWACAQYLKGERGDITSHRERENNKYNARFFKSREKEKKKPTLCMREKVKRDWKKYWVPIISSISTLSVYIIVSKLFF